MSLALESDFLDYYDHNFAATFSAARPHTCSAPDACRHVWQRLTRTPWTRRADLRTLAEVGLTVPKNGTREAFADANDAVVIYDDPRAHRGEGKRRGFAGQMRADDFASAWVSGWDSDGKSWRALGVGHRTFWLRYVSKDDWRSNCGDVEITWADSVGHNVTEALRVLQAIRRTPVVAVDFVWGGRTEPIAVDLNTAPGLRGTPVEDEVSARDLFAAIEERWKELWP